MPEEEASSCCQRCLLEWFGWKLSEDLEATDDGENLFGLAAAKRYASQRSSEALRSVDRANASALCADKAQRYLRERSDKDSNDEDNSLLAGIELSAPPRPPSPRRIARHNKPHNKPPDEPPESHNKPPEEPPSEAPVTPFDMPVEDVRNPLEPLDDPAMRQAARTFLFEGNIKPPPQELYQ